MALGRTHIVAPLGSTDTERRIVGKVNVALRSLDRRKPIATPSVFRDSTSRPPAESNQGRIIFVRQSDGTVQGQYSDGAAWQTFLATSVSYATPTVTYATTYGAGTLSTTIRSDAVLKFPTAIMSSANSATATMTDDATDMTWTASLGALNIRTATDKLSLPAWTAGGKEAATTGTILGFLATTANLGGSDLRTGVSSRITLNDSATYTSQTFKGLDSQVSTTDTGGATFTSCTVQVADLRLGASAITTNTHTFTERTVLNIVPAVIGQSASGVVTVTDYYGIKASGWTATGTPGTVPNARTILCQMPMVGSTIRRGLHITTTSGAFNNMGTEPANAEGIYIDDLTRGTAQRTGLFIEGASGLTPTDVYGIYQGVAHVVGTNRYGARFIGATTGTPTLCVGVQVDGHAVGTTKWAFRAVTDESYMSGVQQDDNKKDVFGTGRDAEVYFNATDLIIDPDAVGSGIVQIGATGDDDMHLTNIEIDGALNHDGTTVGFYATAPVTVQTPTGSRGGNAALASLLTALAATGIIVDGTSA